MEPVVRVLLERADARRVSLLQLVDAVPAELWSRGVAGDSWTAFSHLAHSLSTDAVLATLIGRFEQTSLEELAALRIAALESSAALELKTLLDLAGERRETIRTLLAALPPAALDHRLSWHLDPRGWGRSVSLSLYAYLEAWAVHDTEHEHAIREAISTSPDLSAIAHARRLR
jgi:hypothetical protein